MPRDYTNRETAGLLRVKAKIDALLARVAPLTLEDLPFVKDQNYWNVSDDRTAEAHDMGQLYALLALRYNNQQRGDLFIFCVIRSMVETGALADGHTGLMAFGFMTVINQAAQAGLFNAERIVIRSIHGQLDREAKLTAERSQRARDAYARRAAVRHRVSSIAAE